MYAHALCPSICEVQYQFYNEEIAIAEKIGVGVPRYSYESFFNRRSILAQEYMGLDKDGKEQTWLPLDEPTTESNTGPQQYPPPLSHRGHSGRLQGLSRTRCTVRRSDSDHRFNDRTCKCNA